MKTICTILVGSVISISLSVLSSSALADSLEEEYQEIQKERMENEQEYLKRDKELQREALKIQREMEHEAQKQYQKMQREDCEYWEEMEPEQFKDEKDMYQCNSSNFFDLYYREPD